MKSRSGLMFYDWDAENLIRRIEIIPRNVRSVSAHHDHHRLHLFLRSIGVKMVHWFALPPKSPTTFFGTILKLLQQP